MFALNFQLNSKNVYMFLVPFVTIMPATNFIEKLILLNRSSDKR